MYVKSDRPEIFGRYEKNIHRFLRLFRKKHVTLQQKSNIVYKMKRKLLLLALVCGAAVSAFAGGLMTNTNYHIAFDRMMARGATFDIDAAYSNPAGLAWGHNGWQLSLNFQKPWQRRNIETTLEGQQTSNFYKGVASAPIVPALFASYKKDRWALSAMLGIVGSGGFCEYEDGVPMFNLVLQGMLSQKGVTPGQYRLDTSMKGKQYIYGGQVNFTYRFLDCLSAAVGLRVNYYDGYYRGHVVADKHFLLGDLATLRVDVDQTGWGVAPIIGVNYHKGPLTLAARYEFRTKISAKNSTNTLEASLGDGVTNLLKVLAPSSLKTINETLEAKTQPYKDGEKTRYDMPALLVAAVGYEFTPKLRATLEYHFFDDKNANMAGGRQKELQHGTHEFLAGAEYDINKKWTVSAGIQRTDYGLSDGYQQNTSFACDSWSVGLGGAWNITEKMRLNAGYFITLYSDYTKQCNAQRDGYAGKDVYSRSNNVIGIGLDYRF